MPIVRNVRLYLPCTPTYIGTVLTAWTVCGPSTQHTVQQQQQHHNNSMDKHNRKLAIMITSPCPAGVDGRVEDSCGASGGNAPVMSCSCRLCIRAQATGSLGQLGVQHLGTYQDALAQVQNGSLVLSLEVARL